MSDTKQVQFTISVEVGDGDKFEFYRFDQVATWASTEFGVFTRILDAVHKSAHPCSPEVMDAYAMLKHVVEKAIELSNSEVVGKARRETFSRQLQNYFKKVGRKLPIADRQKRFTQVEKAILEGRVDDANDIFETIIESAKIQDISAESSKNIEMIGKKKDQVFNGELEDLRRLLGDEIAKLSENLQLLEGNNSRLSRETSIISDELKALQKPQKEFLEDASKKMTELKQTQAAMRDQIGLDEASKYWGDEGKQKRHSNRFRLFLGVLAAWLGLGSLTLWKMLADYRAQVADAETIYMIWCPIYR